MCCKMQNPASPFFDLLRIFSIIECYKISVSSLYSQKFPLSIYNV